MDIRDMGERAHIPRNECGTPATKVIRYFAPVGDALRIHQHPPNNWEDFTRGHGRVQKRVACASMSGGVGKS
jgi:hypothetical protein